MGYSSAFFGLGRNNCIFTLLIFKSQTVWVYYESKGEATDGYVYKNGKHDSGIKSILFHVFATL